MKIYAPLSGVVTDLASVPDPVISKLMLGPGFAIQPDQSVHKLGAPVPGIIQNARTHAVIIDGPETVLVHAGIDTFALTDGLDTLVAVDDSVIIGTSVLEMDVAKVEEADRNPIVCVTVLGGDKAKLVLDVEPGTHVERGELIGNYDL